MELTKDDLNTIIHRLDIVARSYGCEYGLPIEDAVRMALMREAIQETIDTSLATLDEVKS